MAKRIIGIVLIALAIFCAYLGFSASAGAPENKEIIENAVYVSDGKVLSENEGKVVIVPGTLDADLPFVDPETGIKLHTVVSYRRVEKLNIRKEEKGTDTDKRTYEYWSWDLTVSENDYGGSKKLIAPNVTLGEFAVEKNLLQAVSVSENRTEYSDKKELNRMGWNVFTDDGKVYLYTGDYMPDDADSVRKYYLDYLHTLRVSYDELSADNTLEYTIIGRQEDGQLVKAQELDMLAVHSGYLTTDALLEYADFSAKTATIGAIVAVVVLLGIGAFLIVKGGKEKK